VVWLDVPAPLLAACPSNRELVAIYCGEPVQE